MTNKSNKIDWIMLFHITWIGLLLFGIFTTFLKICGIIHTTWFITTLPIWTSYAFFAIVLFAILIVDKVNNLFKKFSR